jgi:Leucine-rich repeat (LRR) protein
VFEVVASLHSVVELLMDGNRISDAFSRMKSSSPHLSSLRTLSLRTNRIRHLDRLPALPALTTLLLDGNDLGDSMQIACLAASCPALESLSLTWCSIKNLSRACAALSNLPKLRVLAFQVGRIILPYDPLLTPPLLPSLPLLEPYAAAAHIA